MYVYTDKSYMFYAFYIFDSAKVIFFSMIYTWFIIVLHMYAYIDNSYMLYVQYFISLIWSKLFFLV